MLGDSLKAADEIVLKDVYQKEKIPEKERLDVSQIKEELEKRGKKAVVFGNYEEIVDFIMNISFKENNIIVIISNGSFGNIPLFVKSIKEQK